MAARINCTMQNSLLLLNPLNSKATTYFNNRLKFRQNFFSLSKKAMFCICTINNDKTNTDSTDPFVLTTPLYYVNAPPHMGSAYTNIAADAIARFQRLLGKKVVFITGTDEHGEKIAASAAAGGSSPREHCDVISQAYKTLWKDLDIAYDKFIRTTDPKHEEIVKEFYSRVLANGDIYKADYEGLYCINCEEYKDEKELLENHCCPIHLKPCVAQKEDNYFFALSKYQKPLEETLTQNPDFVQPSFRLNEVQSWIKSGLRDFSISRASVDWGIPVPNDNKQTIYVWFDALLGYISALSGNKDQPNLQTAVSSGWPASLHLIGKDILRFHAVYWPAMLMSAGLPVPKKVFGHGFLTKSDISSSRRWNLVMMVTIQRTVLSILSMHILPILYEIFLTVLLGFLERIANQLWQLIQLLLLRELHSRTMWKSWLKMQGVIIKTYHYHQLVRLCWKLVMPGILT